MGAVTPDSNAGTYFGQSTLTVFRRRGSAEGRNRLVSPFPLVEFSYAFDGPGVVDNGVCCGQDTGDCKHKLEKRIQPVTLPPENCWFHVLPACTIICTRQETCPFSGTDGADRSGVARDYEK